MSFTQYNFFKQATIQHNKLVFTICHNTAVYASRLLEIYRPPVGLYLDIIKHDLTSKLENVKTQYWQRGHFIKVNLRIEIIQEQEHSS